MPLEKQICFKIVWGCAKILPLTVLQFSSRFEFFVRKAKNVHVNPAAGGLWHVTINGLMCHKTVLSLFSIVPLIRVWYRCFSRASSKLFLCSPIFTKCAILELKNWTYTLSPCVLFSMSVDGFHSPSATLDTKLNKLTSFLGLFFLTSDTVQTTRIRKMEISWKGFRTCKFILANIKNFENEVGISLV